ncbi:hypothetical protein J2795_000359 [Chryseobacterium bernardetii]|uniref:Uncharacterized protein n=1 Tax=Chryseobacterium bernardetii TaxID=1241978 RepID=A0ACC6IQ09_9FLAO|nr:MULTISPECIES: hypothetical protein [Chryseobacterium]MDR6369404.1 hypothetical protein [Chryseobacterium vietnamense]MDR6439674.1 hypothetical protein [Chryseobacterium bernardetii]
MQQYKSKKSNRKINASAFYHEGYQWKVVLPTIIVNYLQEKVQEQPPFKEFKMDNALYFLSLVISIPAYKKDKTYLWGFIPMDSTRLKKKDSNYSKYFEYFLQIGLLQGKGHSKGRTCKRYRYNYENINLEGVECLDFSIFEMTDKFLTKNLLKENISNDCPHLSKWFDDGLFLDVDRLNDDMSSEFCYNKYSLSYTRLNPIMAKAYSYWYTALMLREQCYRISRQLDSDNRLHTNLTNMPSKFRPYLTYHGENIQSLDIKNSQPYFMVLVLESLSNSKILEIMNRVFGSSNIGTMLQKLQQIKSNKAFQVEFAPLKKAVLTGQFYEFLIPLFVDIQPDFDGVFRKKFYDSDIGKAKVVEFPTKRDLMKKLTLQILYTPLKRPSKEYLIFKLHFPLLCECIEVFKTTSDEKDSFKLFPKLLQHVESDCVIDTITKQIAKTNPDMPLWTIHDSFCTTQSWFPVLQYTVQELFLSYSGGVLPSFKPELWCNTDECLKVA